LANLASVNGRVVPLSRAMVPVLDRGYLFADGVYEVLRTYGGRIFEPEAHLDRLDQSLRGARIPWPLPRAALLRHLHALLRRSRFAEARIYVQVTRGVAPRQHGFPRGVRPAWVAWVEALPPPDPRPYRRGVRLRTMPDPRWARCDLKSIALLPNVLAKQAAVDAGADDAVFLGPGGVVREASSATLFVIQGRRLRTHPLGHEILPGVSRGVVIEVARAAGFRVLEGRFRRATLYAADEVFLASTIRELLPVVRVDGHRIGAGRPGPRTAELHAAFTARARAAAPRPRRRHHTRPARRRREEAR
jgi:D-alanine transaminase